MRHALLIILVNALLLAAGILVVLVACFQFHNFLPLLTILVDVLAIGQLMTCGACSAASSELDAFMSFDGGSNSALIGLQLSWLLFGLFVVFGYGIPSLLYRAGSIPEVALYFTWGGGTIILAAMIIYMRVIYRQQ